MNQIAFATLLTGLIVGVQPVRVILSADVHPAAVVYSLKGRMVARATSPPWEAQVDFGPTLEPVEISAEAVDQAGDGIAGISRIVNLPAPAARLDILLTRDALGAPVGARLVATSVRKESPSRMTVSLDGNNLKLDRDGYAALPSVNLKEVHVLSAVAEFAQDAIAKADLALGGGIAEESGARLTAVAVRIQRGSEPTAQTLQGRLRRGSDRLLVVAVEKPPSTVVMVRDPNSANASRLLGRNTAGTGVRLEPDDRVALVWPLSHEEKVGDQVAQLLEATPYFTGKQGGLLWVLTRVTRQGPSMPPYRYADALAIAGIEAYRSGTRRAIVLASYVTADASQLTPSQVKGYVETLGVPLHVWSFGSAQSPWGIPEVVNSFVGYERAATALKEDLDTQRIVWVAGEWLPGQIVLTPGSDGVTLLR